MLMFDEDSLFAENTLDQFRLPHLSFVVYGTPAPQGSKRAFLNKKTGRPIVVESSKAVRPWREAVKSAALDARVEAAHTPFDGPVAVNVAFVLPRPKGHYGTGRNAGQVKDSAPPYPSVRPDLDKLVRSTLDALGDAAVFGSDAQIVSLRAAKVYPGDLLEAPGAVIEVRQHPRLLFPLQRSIHGD